MRVKLIFSLSALVGFGLLAVPTLAQEDSQSNAEIQELNSHQELNLNDDKTLIMDADLRPPKIASVVKDSPPTPPIVIKKEQQKPSSQTDKTHEDPLSFNFLYFIIQKFKISDIMDD